MSTSESGRSTVSRIRSTSAVRPAMQRAPAAAARNADCSSAAFAYRNGNTGYGFRAAVATAVTMLV